MLTYLPVILSSSLGVALASHHHYKFHEYDQDILAQHPTTYTDAETPLLHTRNGTYTGIYSPNYDQDFFLGVPYAQPPVENLRWRLPQSVNTSFTGTREAVKYPPNCIGLGGDSWGYPLSEDCLYLNIIRPHVSQADQAKTQDEPLPIAVWIHGGGFYMGGSGDLRFNMSMIVDNAQKAGTPFIAISLNYRLNGFGFLYSNEIRGEGATNLGLRDQRLALHWVRLSALRFLGTS